MNMKCEVALYLAYLNQQKHREWYIRITLSHLPLTNIRRNNGSLANLDNEGRK